MKYAIDDKLLKKMSNVKSKVCIDGEFYFITTETDFVVGDIVLDRGDACCGVIDMIIGDKAAVKSDGCAELGVPLVQLVKLRKFNENNTN